MNRSTVLILVAIVLVALLVLVIFNALTSQSTAEIELRSDARAEISRKVSFNASDLPQPLVCGAFLNSRISGGEETELNEFPWMALIEHTRDDGGTSYHCGGTLINKDYVLTAAHCIKGKFLLESEWKVTGVRLGEWDLNSDPDCKDNRCADPVVDMPISEFIVHENYDAHSKNHEHDIALLRLNQSVPFTKWVKPLCLPTASVLRDKEYGSSNTFVVAGWGRTEVTKFSDIKLKVEVPAYPLNECIEKYRPKDIFLTENQLCAGGAPGKDACKGDSGGPVMQMDNTNRKKPFMFLAGIVSFGKKKCGTTGWPGIYTRVDRYTDWILEHMRP